MPRCQTATAYCGIIVDGRHVHPEVLKLALRCKPHDRFMLVTDAWANVGTTLTSFQLQGATIHVRDGVCVDEKGVLAGSAMDMSRAVRNAMIVLGVSLSEALTMASAAPAAFLGLASDYGSIAKGFRANFVVADDGVDRARHLDRRRSVPAATKDRITRAFGRRTPRRLDDLKARNRVLRIDRHWRAIAQGADHLA